MNILYDKFVEFKTQLCYKYSVKYILTNISVVLINDRFPDYGKRYLEEIQYTA